MNNQESTVTIHMVSSLDGFIAKKDDDVSWMHSSDTYEKGIDLTEDIIKEFLDRIDCYVMGSHTYEHALKLGWPYGDIPVYVVSSRDFNSKKDSVLIYDGASKTLVQDVLRPKFKNIWMVGGSKLTKDFIKLDLVDEIVITIMPILLGDGTLFFDFVGRELPLHLKDVTAYKDGMVELHYEIIKESN